MWQWLVNIFRLPRFNQKEPWQISAARFCKDKDEGFTQQQLFEFLDRLGISKTAQRQFFSDAISHPMGSKFGREHDKGIWTAPVELVSMVIDYDELKEARENSVKANQHAIAAIVISTISVIIGFVTLGFQIYSNHLTRQSIQLSTDPQIEIFLKYLGRDESGQERISLGIQNVGVMDISNLRVKSATANVGSECRKTGLGGLDVERDEKHWEEFNRGKTIDIALDYNPALTPNDGPPDMGIYTFNFEYQRQIDQRIYSEKVKFALDGLSVYWDENMLTNGAIVNSLNCAEGFLSIDTFVKDSYSADEDKIKTSIIRRPTRVR